jgi:hypothetical protein
LTSTEKRRERRERCAAKYAARSFAESVRASDSEHNGHSGVAYAVGGGLINVPAVRARMPAMASRRSAPVRHTSLESSNRAFELLMKG